MFTRLCLLSLFVSALPLSAQQPSQAQVQQALQQPGIADQLRQRIQSSGLTPDQIRARLSASGYSPTLLDAYLGGAASGGVQTAPGALELQAISALGLPLFETPLLPVDTGLMRSRSGYTPSRDRKSTRLNSSHLVISYAVFCLKKKKNQYSFLLFIKKKKKKKS